MSTSAASRSVIGPSGSQGPAGPNYVTVTQANSFNNGQAVYFNGTSWQLAVASGLSALSVGLVNGASPSSFNLYYTGPFALTASTYTAGNYYYVSDATSGSLTSTEPTASGSYSNPILFATSSFGGLVLPFRPSSAINNTKLNELSAPNITSLTAASANVFGTVKLSTAPVSASVPIAVGNNDTRLPPTPGTANKMIIDTGSAYQAVLTYGTYANMPATNLVTGQRYTCTDSSTADWVYDGSAWRPIINNVICVAPPLSGSWTSINTSTSTIVQNNGSVTITGVNDASTATFRGYGFTLSSATAFVEASISLCSNQSVAASTFDVVGVFMRESGTSKVYEVAWTNNHVSTTMAHFLELDVWTGNTTRTVNASVFVSRGFDSNAPVILRVRRSGTNMVAELSRDRRLWTTIDSRATSGVFTTAPDTVGICTHGFNVIPQAIVPHFNYGSL